MLLSKHLKQLPSRPEMIKALVIVVITAGLAACGANKAKPVVASTVPPEKAYEYGLKAMSQQQFDQAIPLFEVAAKQVGAPVETRANLGLAYLRNGEFDKGMEILDKALKFIPNNPDVLNEMAIAYRKQGEFGKARELYEKSLASNPTHASSHYNLGVLCDLYLQDLNCAITHYKQYLVAFGQEDKQVNIWLKDLEGRKSSGEGS